MKTRHHIGGALLVAAALLRGCNDDNAPQGSTIITTPTPPPGPVVPPTSMSFSQFAASLIAMVMGTTGSNSCSAALPADVNGSTATDDMTAQDANAITVNCS